MSEKSTSTYTILYLCSKLRVSAHELLAQSHEAATNIASVDGLIWKIWIRRDKESEVGGVYLFANRKAAEAYLKHPVIQALRSSSAVISTESRLFEVEGYLSAITRAPLRDDRSQYSEIHASIAGGQ